MKERGIMEEEQGLGKRMIENKYTDFNTILLINILSSDILQILLIINPKIRLVTYYTCNISYRNL